MTAPSRSGATPPPLPSTGGGHQLPPAFSADGASAAAPSTRRRPHRGLVAGLLGAAAVVAAVSVAQLTANLGYDSAAARYERAADTATVAKTAVGDDTAVLRGAVDAGGSILTVGNQPIVVADDLVTGLSAAVAEGTATVADADGVVSTDIPAQGTKPGWFWELFGATSALDQHRDDVDDLSGELETVSTEVSDALTAITTSGVRMMTAAGDGAPGFEAAHLSARNDAVIALRTAAADAAATTAVDDTAATAYLALQTAASQVVATESAELAEKSGPLMGARLEIEAFARSLAPGVLLEFDWAPVVSGAGDNGSMGGYTTWWWDDPGRATIELSNSVAEQWPADRSRALIAHEVGHAISVKCQGMYDASTADSIEKWATAWAISMGFTDDANGVWAYGYPPQEYIDAAAGCR